MTRRDVEVGSDLIADLSGADFNIVRVGNDDGKRTLATGNFAEWQWDVLPLHSGQRNLSLVLYVRLVDGGPPVDVKTFTEEIEVRVNALHSVSQWVQNYWAATGLTVPVIVGAIWWVVVYRRKAGDAPAVADGEPVSGSSNSGKRPPRNKRKEGRYFRSGGRKSRS